MRALASRSGPQAFAWDGRDKSGRRAPAGVYFFELRVGNRTTSGRLVYIR
jgi:hypothetical protein